MVQMFVVNCVNNFFLHATQTFPIPNATPTIECNPPAASDNDEVSIEGSSDDIESAII